MKTLLFLTVLIVVGYGVLLRAQDQKNNGSKRPQPPAAVPNAPYKNVGVEEFDKMRKEKDTVVLDVRTEKEFKGGHIPGAVNIDVNAKDFDEQVAKLGKDKTFLVHCAAGVRSMRACKALAPAGISKLFNLEEGFKAWEKAGKPVEK